MLVTEKERPGPADHDGAGAPDRDQDVCAVPDDRALPARQRAWLADRPAEASAVSSAAPAAPSALRMSASRSAMGTAQWP